MWKILRKYLSKIIINSNINLSLSLSIFTSKTVFMAEMKELKESTMNGDRIINTYDCVITGGASYLHLKNI